MNPTYSTYSENFAKKVYLPSVLKIVLKILKWNHQSSFINVNTLKTFVYSGGNQNCWQNY